MNPSTIALSLTTLAIVYYLADRIYDVFFGPLSRFPGPKLFAWTRIPLISGQISGNDNHTLPALHEKYGPVVRIAPRELSFANAQGFQDIYGFKKAGQPKPFKPKMFYGTGYNKVASIISADDANHSRQRKILSHAFSDRALKEQEPLLRKWAGKMLAKLTEQAQRGGEVDMLKFLNCTTFDIMGDLTFSEGLDMLEGSEFSPWIKTIFAGLKFATLIRGIKQLGSVVDWFVENVLLNNDTVRAKQKEHWDYSKDRVDLRLKKTPEQPDLWTKILEKSEGPDALTLGEHHSIASLFMIAGTETTATALSGTIYQLLRNPDILAKVVQEVRSNFTTFDDLSLEKTTRLKYTQAVLQEGLRIYPPVPTALCRAIPKGGAAICGEWVPEDTIVGVHQLSTYRSERNFKHAMEFHPERWLGDPDFKDDDLAAWEPFSTGPRNCLGKNLAWYEMRLLLATVLLHFDLELCDESKGWANQKVYILWEKVPLMCRLTLAKA